MTKEQIEEPVRQAIKQAVESLMDEQIPGLVEKLHESADGEITWSVSLKVVKFQSKVVCSGSSNYKQTFKGEAESCVDIDDNQPGLFGGEQ